MNLNVPVRELVRRALEAKVNPEPGAGVKIEDYELELSAEDRGLFQELTQGTLREWKFLDWCLGRYAKKPPRGLIRTVMLMSAYQLLFLDRVPAFAIFSEAKSMAERLKLSEAELKFVHGVLKAIETDRENLTRLRSESLARAAQGAHPESELDLAVLNVDPSLIDAMTFTENQKPSRVEKAEARSRAVKAIAAMKHKLPLLGYALPSSKGGLESFVEKFESKVASHAIVLKPGMVLQNDLEADRVRVQGEASQWSCELAAKKILALHEVTSANLRIVEMASGKGGKLLGTLTALTALCGNDPKKIPAMEWLAVDSSPIQLEIFERDTAAVVQTVWPQVMVSSRCYDWKGSLEGVIGKSASFDLVWLDAPCSGFGTLAKLPEIALTRADDAYTCATDLSQIQKRLCSAGLKLVGPGGSFLYSVCTLTRPETIDIVSFCAEKAPDLAQSKEGTEAHYLWPGSEPAPRAEGFFVALF